MLVDRILKGAKPAVSPWSELERGIGRVLAEFSFWPLGWVLTFDDATVQGALDTIPAWTAAQRDRDAWRRGARL